MKHLFRIFELTKNEQRVVLIVMLVLATIGFVGYEHRVHRFSTQPTAAIKANPSPSPAEPNE